MNAVHDDGREPPSTPLPHFGSSPHDPVLPPGEAGVAIASAGLEGGSEARRWPLHGTFRVPRALFAGEPEQALRRIVIVLTSSASDLGQARYAFHDELLFPEDVQDDGRFVSGAFHLDLLRRFAFSTPSDTYFVLASIGEHLSNVLCCAITLPWRTAPSDAPADAADPADAEAEDALEEEEEDDGDLGWMVDD